MKWKVLHVSTCSGDSRLEPNAAANKGFLFFFTAPLNFAASNLNKEIN